MNSGKESIVICGAKVWTKEGFRVCDVEISGGKTTRIEEHIIPAEGAKIVEAEGLHLLPGLVDMHVHLREPGYGYKETIASGTCKCTSLQLQGQNKQNAQYNYTLAGYGTIDVPNEPASAGTD